ncbi:thioredoxin family protein [Pseudanabaenaceae cyanobacterium LEGE 13415]|uniref:thioredoxin family protein n=1 Tax=unclassified Leptolyngbya TaxID=2650499 RepID=UPI0019F6DAC9|nr:thioredoxin family protein [Pseudanabaenaceae cyanobacterium LEGE 13415]
MIQTSQSALSLLQQQSEKPILAKFVAPHCGGCNTLKPVLEQLARTHAEQLHLIEIDITEEPELAIELDVRSVPTVVLFQQEQEIGRLVGLQPKQHYTNLVQQVV